MSFDSSDLYDITQLLKEILGELRILNAKKTRPRGEKKTRVELPPIAEIWNQFAAEPLPRVVAMETSSTRYKNCVARWEAFPDAEYWKKVIERVNQSDFCLGKNDRKWVADIEFLTRSDTHARILEGKFDNKGAKPNPSGELAYDEERETWYYRK